MEDVETLLLMKGQFNEKRIAEPLGISLLASIVREKCSCKTIIYDPHIDGDTIGNAADKILDINPQILGISAIEPDKENVLQLVAELRKRGAEFLIVIGGYGPTLSAEQFLIDGVNLLFIGESEISFPMFINKVLAKEDYFDVPGIAYKNANGEIIKNPPCPRVENLDELPFISRDVLKEVQSKYKGYNSAQLISSRGCYMNCGYCSVKAFANAQEGPIYRERSIYNVVSEIRYLYEELGVRHLFFEDDNFIPGNLEKAKRKISEFYALMKELNCNDLSFYIQCRPDNLQVELIKQLRDIGLKEIFFGIESINKEDLDLYSRPTDIEKVYNNLRKLNTIGYSCRRDSELRLHFGYIMFNPYTNRERLMNSLNLFKEFNVTPKKLLSYLRPFSNTPVYEILKKEGLVDIHNNIIFKDKETAEIFSYANKIIKAVLDFRERLRVVYKMNKKQLPDICINDLEKARKDYDSLCFEAFEQLLIKPVSEYPSIQTLVLDKAEDIRTSVFSKLSHAENQLGIDKQVSSMFI